MTPIPWQLTAIDGSPIFMMEPHAPASRDTPLAMRGSEVVVPSGARIIDKDPAAPTARHEFEFIAATRDEVAFLEDFFDSCQGKAGAFWFPTWQWEFDVYGYSGSTMHVSRTGYLENIYPLGRAYRRFVMLRGGAWRVFTLLEVTPSVAPNIDLLGWNGGVGASSDPGIPAAIGPLAQRDDSYRPLWLRYGRFDQDELVAESLNGDGACTIHLAMVELPRETPALVPAELL